MIKCFSLKMMCLWASDKKKIWNFFASLESMKKGVGSGVGSGSISQRYGSGDPDPDPHQNVTYPDTGFTEDEKIDQYYTRKESAFFFFLDNVFSGFVKEILTKICKISYIKFLVLNCLLLIKTFGSQTAPLLYWLYLTCIE